MVNTWCVHMFLSLFFNTLLMFFYIFYIHFVSKMMVNIWTNRFHNHC